MKNLKLAAKIGVGFGLLIAISLALGAIAILNMLGVQTDARRLSGETIPQVRIANDIERSALLTTYEMRGYDLSGDQAALQSAKASLDDVRQHLGEAESLATRSPRLAELLRNTRAARTQVDQYSFLADQTVSTQRDIGLLRAEQDSDYAAYMTRVQAFRKARAAVLDRTGRMDAVNRLVDLGAALRAASFQAQAMSDPSVLEQALKDFSVLDDTIRGVLPSVSAADRQTLADIQAAGESLADACRRLLSSMKDLADLTTKKGTAAQAVLDAARTTSLAGLADAATVTTVSVTRLLTATLVLVAGLAGAMLLGIALSLAITRAIARPLVKAVAFAELIAAGDFTHHLAISQRDEVGALAGALNGMADRLRRMVAAVQENASRVAASSADLSASAEKLAEGAQSQASTLEETSASVEELTASVDQVAEHARGQSEAVLHGTASMTQTKTAMAGVSSSLVEIETLADASVRNAVDGSTAVQRVVEGIHQIAESSERIEGIVTVISDIADQTNLLALNASIEAARAGEHGRGFAVVAGEVSKLAERSAASTREITGLIKESARHVTEGVEVAMNSQAAMEQIKDASRKVKEMIGGLTGSMAQQVAAVYELSSALTGISEMSRSITAATEEQTTNARQVARAVENVNELTQGAASAASQVSEATTQLSTMAQELQHLASQFRIKGGAEVPQIPPRGPRALPAAPGSA